MIHINQDQKLVATDATLISNKMVDTGSAVLADPKIFDRLSKHGAFLIPSRIFAVFPHPPVSVFPTTAALLP